MISSVLVLDVSIRVAGSHDRYADSMDVPILYIEELSYELSFLGVVAKSASWGAARGYTRNRFLIPDTARSFVKYQIRS